MYLRMVMDEAKKQVIYKGTIGIESRISWEVFYMKIGRCEIRKLYSIVRVFS
ncbi:MAG: hypothetical protein ACTSXH_05095 [Promethearchaeota archaeon]